MKLLQLAALTFSDQVWETIELWVVLLWNLGANIWGLDGAGFFSAFKANKGWNWCILLCLSLSHIFCLLKTKISQKILPHSSNYKCHTSSCHHKIAHSCIRPKFFVTIFFKKSITSGCQYIGSRHCSPPPFFGMGLLDYCILTKCQIFLRLHYTPQYIDTGNHTNLMLFFTYYGLYNFFPKCLDIDA